MFGIARRVGTKTRPQAAEGDRADKNVQMGPALLPTPLAPVAITGVSLRWVPERTCRSYVARRSRRHPVPSGGRSGASTFPPGLAVPRSGIPWGPCASSESGPAEASPFPSAPSRITRPPATCPRVPSTGRASIRKSSRLPCFQAARLPPPYRNRPTPRPSSGFEAFRKTIGLLASTNGCCSRRPSRSSFASPTYPPQDDFTVDKSGKLRRLCCVCEGILLRKAVPPRRGRKLP